MARKSSAAIAAVPSTEAPMHGPHEPNPRRRKRGKGRHRTGKRRRRNPKKNLGYGAKVGIAIAAVAVVGGGGYMLYRRYKKPAAITPVQAYFIPGVNY